MEYPAGQYIIYAYSKLNFKVNMKIQPVIKILKTKLFSINCV